MTAACEIDISHVPVVSWSAMKRLKSLSIYLTILLLAASCSSSDIPVIFLLEPDGKTLSAKLPYLDDLNHSHDGGNAIGQQAYPYTIWERELRKNILDQEAEDRGSVEIVEIYRNESLSFWKTRRYIDISYEIRIYNEDGRIVWNRTYNRAESYSLPLFGPRENRRERMQTESLMMKSVIEEFKDDIEEDYTYITGRLMQ